MAIILAADIGGTNSRFQAFEAADETLRPLEEVWLPTPSAPSFGGLLQALTAAGFPHSPGSCAATVLAVPGPVERGRYASMANIPWDIDLDDPDNHLQGLFVRLVNDFVAQGYASRTAVMEHAQQIKPGTPDPGAPLAVIGAGTGLGHCVTLPDGRGGYLAVPAEAGHTAFAFIGEEEEAFHAFLRTELGLPYAFGDVVVSGPGLSLLHRYLTGEDLSPGEAAARAAPGSPTARLFARFYGRAARHYTLCVVAFAGLVIAGGVAAKNPHLVDNDDFRDEFVLSPRYHAQLAAVPIHLNRDERSGLFGAAFFGAQSLGLLSGGRS